MKLKPKISTNTFNLTCHSCYLEVSASVKIQVLDVPIKIVSFGFSNSEHGELFLVLNLYLISREMLTKTA